MTKIRPPGRSDRREWEQHYRGYADFYRIDTSAVKLATWFHLLMDPAEPRNGLLAVARDDGLTGLAQYRAMPSPLRGAEVGFLNDLFVDPYRRGDGTGEALLRRVHKIAVTRCWGVARWITRDNNYPARGLHDQLSHRSDWITYEMTAATTGREVK